MDTLALMAVCDLRERSFTSATSDGDVGQSSIIKEILGARADSMSNKMEMNNSISLYGYAKQQDMSSPKINQSQSVNTLDVYLMGAGMKSNLILDGLLTKQGLKTRQEESRDK